MRRAITAISFMLSGASVLIFILALFIPLLRETPSQAVKGETEAYESSSSLKKTIEKLEPKHRQNPAVNNEIQPSITQPQAEVMQNQSNGLPSSTQPVSLLVLGEGVFPPGEVTPKANVQEAIDKIIPIINARSPDNVVVEGHTDNWLPGGVSPVQASKWNTIISFLRANAVAKVLKQKGVASDRIIVKGLNDAVPIASNRTRAGRAKNRRVEIKLSPAQ